MGPQIPPVGGPMRVRTGTNCFSISWFMCSSCATGGMRPSARTLYRSAPSLDHTNWLRLAPRTYEARQNVQDGCRPRIESTL